MKKTPVPAPCVRCHLVTPRFCPYTGVKLEWIYQEGETWDEDEWQAKCDACGCEHYMSVDAPEYGTSKPRH